MWFRYRSVRYGIEDGLYKKIVNCFYCGGCVKKQESGSAFQKRSESLRLSIYLDFTEMKGIMRGSFNNALYADHAEGVRDMYITAGGWE